MANSLLDRVPNLPRAEDLDMRNFSRNSVGPQPLPEAMRPNMRDSVGAQPQAAPQSPDLRANPDAQPRNPGMANPQARAAYSEMGRGAAQPATPSPTGPAQTAQPPVGNRDLLRDIGRRVGGAAAGLKNWAVGDRPEAKGWAGKGWNGVKGIGQAAARIGGAVQFGDTLRDNFNAMQGVASDPKSSLSDHFAGGVEMIGNTAASGAANLSKKMPYIGPAVAGYLGNDAASRFVETMAPGSSVLKKHGLGRGALMEAAGFVDPKLNQPAQPTQAEQPQAAAPQAAAPQAQPQDLVRDLDYEQQLQALGQSFEARPGMARPDLGYGVHDRTTMTNEQVGDMNPQGRVTVTRGPNGTMEFSGNDVRGAVSYQDDQGKALAGGGLRGQGFGNFNIAPADSNVAMGPNGSYAYSNSPNLRDFSPGGNGITGRTEYADGQVPQIIQDARRSQAESSARAQQLGVNISGMAPWQANQYMDEVQQARNINASQQANAGSYEERLKQLNDPTSDISKAMRRITSDMPDEFRNKRKYMAQHMQQQNEAALRLAGDYLGETDRIRKDGTSRYGIDEVSRAAEMKDATDRRNADLQAMSNIYSSQISAAGDARKAAVEERNYLNTRNDKALERLDKVFETQATDPKTGQVDPSHLNRLRTGAQAFIGNAADQYEKSGQHAKAEQLRQQGVAALSDDPSLMRRYSAALQADKLGRERFIGHDYVGTDNPGAVTVKEVKGNTVYMSNGTSLPLSTMRYQNNGVLPHRFANLDWFSDPTDEYAAIDPNNQIWGKK